MKAALGIDPGGTGAAVFISPKRTIQVYRFSKLSWYEVAANIVDDTQYFDIQVLIENVHTFGEKGAASKHNDFEFGKNTGIITGIIYAANIPFELINPKTWQYAFSLGGKWAPLGSAKAKEKTARKRAHQTKAQKLFPDLKVTLDTCDALLIAEYQWRRLFEPRALPSSSSSRPCQGTKLIT